MANSLDPDQTAPIHTVCFYTYLVSNVRHFLQQMTSADNILNAFFLGALRFNSFPCEPVHEIPNKMVCATSKASDQPAHTRRLIRAFVVA